MRIWLSIGAAVFSACALASIWEPFLQSSCAWLALVPLLLLTRHCAVRRAWWLGCLTGFISWSVQLVWMLRLTDNGGPWPLVIPAWLGLSAVLALFIGAFSAWSATLWHRLGGNAFGRIALVTLLDPIGWVAMECLRSNIFSGFAWNPLGLATTQAYLPVAQVASLGGVALVSALLVAVNGAVATLCERFWQALTHTAPDTFRERFARSIECILPLTLLLVAFLWGLERIRAYDAQSKTKLASIVVERTSAPCLFTGKPSQPLWEAGAEKAELLALIKPDLWLWPESSASGGLYPYYGVARVNLKHLASSASTPLLVGGVYEEAKTKAFWNAALLFTEQGLDTAQVYGKRHLVPFGEYIPGDKLFPSLQRFAPTGTSLTPATACAVITTPSGLRVGPLICFEDTVAGVARESVLAGAEILVNMSNDAWYAPSPETAQHARQAILRCIETGVPMVRSTNGGCNLAIDAVGRTSDTEAFPTRLPITAQPFASAYLRFGEGVFGAPCVLIFFCVVVFLGFRRWRVKPTLILVLTLLFCARFANAEETSLLPMAEMAAEDGNLSLAERMTRSVLSKLGISTAERTRAQEVLIRTALAKGNWAEALKQVEACADLSADHRLAYQLTAYDGMKDYAQVEQTYASAHPSLQNEWGVAALRLALRADLALGKKVRAAERFAEVDSARGAKDRVRAENARLWVQHFPNRQSRSALLKAAEEASRGGVFLDCALALPRVFAETDERASAVKCLEEVLAQKGLSTAIEARLALAAMELDTTPEARQAHARQALSVAREESLRRQASVALGEILCKDPATAEEGITLLQDAVSLNPSAPEAPSIRLQIAEAFYRLNRPEDALKEYDQYIANYDEPTLRSRVLLGRARVMLAVNRPEDALDLFLRASAQEEDAAQRRALLLEAADAAMTAQKPAKACDLYKQVLAEQSSPEVQLRLARALEADKKPEEARRNYLAVRDDSGATEDDRFIAVMRAGALLSAERRFVEAVALFTQSLPEIHDASHKEQISLERGRAYYEAGNLAKAQEAFSELQQAQSIEVASEARFFLVLCLYGLGDDTKARQLAQTYLSAYPTSPRIPDVILWIAKSDFNVGDYDAAQVGFATFAEKWNQDARAPHALYFAVRAAYQGKNFAQAVVIGERLAQVAPKFELLPEARFLQAEALIELARHSEALEILEPLLSKAPDAPWVAEAFIRKGDCLMMTAADVVERYDQAIASYQEALKRLDNDPDTALGCFFKIGRSLEKKNLRDAAADQYMSLIYTVLSGKEVYSDLGLAWMQKALLRLHRIDLARGNRSGFETLARRVRHARLPGITIPE